jgi:ribose/xylose/arabinose/galactoside ABC-type transport system permease subunit
MSGNDKTALEAELTAETTTDVTANVEPRPSRLRQWATTPILITLTFLLLLIVIFSLLAPGKFGTASNLSLLAQNVAILTVVSVGTTFVIATAGIDLSIPSGIILGEVFAAQTLSRIPVAGGGTAIDIAAADTTLAIILAALAASLIAGLIIGSVNGFLVAYGRIPPMLATLGTLGAGLGVGLLLQKGVNVATYALNPVATGHLIPNVSNLVLIAVLVVIVGYIAMHKSVFGRHTLAIGSNEEAARRVGLHRRGHGQRVRRLSVPRVFLHDVGGRAHDRQPPGDHRRRTRRHEPLRWRRHDPGHRDRRLDPGRAPERLHHRRSQPVLADDRRRGRPRDRRVGRPAATTQPEPTLTRVARELSPTAIAALDAALPGLDAALPGRPHRGPGLPGAPMRHRPGRGPARLDATLLSPRRRSRGCHVRTGR